MSQALASGITGAAPIWHDIMTFLLKDKVDEPPQKPDDVNALTIDALFGGLPYGSQPTRSEYLIKGTEPTTSSPIYKKVDDKTYFVIQENDPVSTDGQNRWQTGIDAWVKENHSAADYQWYPPSNVLTGVPTPTSTLTSPPTPSPSP